MISSPSPDAETPERFNLETKLIVLNFFSQHPVDGKEESICTPSPEGTLRKKKLRYVSLQNNSNVLDKRHNIFKRHSEDNIGYKHNLKRDTLKDYFHDKSDQGNEFRNSFESVRQRRTLAELSDEFAHQCKWDADDEDSQESFDGSAKFYSHNNTLKAQHGDAESDRNDHTVVTNLTADDKQSKQDFDEIDGQFFDDESDLMVSSSTSISLPSSASASNTNLGGSTVDRSKLKLDLSKTQSRPESDLRKDVVISSLMAELEDEMITLENEYEKAVENHEISQASSPFHTPMTPHTEAARFLAKIGDEVKDQYEQRMNLALECLLNLNHNVSYEEFQNIASSIISGEGMSSWIKVTLILIYGQKAALRIVENGYRWLGVGSLVDYITQYLTDQTASFIIQQGGWKSIMNFDPSQSSSDSCSNPSTPENNNLLIHPLTKIMRQHSGAFQVTTDPEAASPMKIVDDTANNNTFNKEAPVHPQPELMEIQELLSDEGDAPNVPNDFEVMDRIFSRQRQPWYYWFTVKEHVGLVFLTFLGIGLSYLFKKK